MPDAIYVYNYRKLLMGVVKFRPNVLVIQRGGRHNYLVPRICESAGLLNSFYTDSYAGSPLGWCAKYIARYIPSDRLKKLNNRVIEGIPPEKIRYCDSWLLRDYCLSKWKSRNLERWLYLRDKQWSAILQRWELVDVNLVYSMSAENLEFLKFARCRGIKVIVDAFINPLTFRIMREEKKRLGYTMTVEEQESNVREKFYKQIYAESDMILCPSEWVADGVRKLCAEHARKILICPYGSSIDCSGRVNESIRGRIFWAGRDWLRKGLYYLAQAADELKVKYPEMDFRAAGITDPEVVGMHIFRNINFLGDLNKKQMKEEFLSADVFVLPTLTEGMAGVVIEAIAAGCPVITTKCAGIDLLESGKNGIVITPRNPSVLVDAIEATYCNRKLRNTLAAKARMLVDNYTVEAWTRRLVGTLRELSS